MVWPVEHHADVVRDALPVRPLTRAVLVAAATHVVRRRYRRVERGGKGDVSGAAHADALLHQPEGALRLLGGDQVERAALVVRAPAPPVRERGHPLQQLILGRLAGAGRNVRRHPRPLRASARSSSGHIVSAGSRLRLHECSAPAWRDAPIVALDGQTVMPVARWPAWPMMRSGAEVAIRFQRDRPANVPALGRSARDTWYGRAWSECFRISVLTECSIVDSNQRDSLHQSY